MEEREGLAVASGVAWAAGLTVLLSSLSSVLGRPVWVTSGRVTYQALLRVSYTGSLPGDLGLAVALTVVSLAACWRCMGRVSAGVAVGLLSAAFVFLGFGGAVWVWIVVLLAGLVIPLRVVVSGGMLAQRFLRGVLVFLAGYSLAVLAGVASFLVYGGPLSHGLPVSTVLTVFYRLWPVSLLLIVASGILAGLRALGLVGPRGHRVPSGLAGWRRAVLLGAAGLLALLVMAVPYFPSVNPRGAPATTDWVYYYRWLLEMDARGVVPVLERHMDRPLDLLLLYGFHRLLGLPTWVLAVYQHLVIGVLYVFASYFAGRRLGGEWLGVLAALLAPVSPGFLSFQYGGFQADLLGLTLILFSAGFLVAAESGRDVVVGLVLLGVVMLVHEWVWVQYLVVLGVYLSVAWWRCGSRPGSGSGSCRYLRMTVAGVVLLVALDLSKWLLYGGSSASGLPGVVGASARYTLGHSVPGVPGWFFLTVYTGGGLNNPLFYILVAAGSLYADLFTAAALLLSLTPFPLVDSVIAYRVLVNAPLQVAGAYSASRLGGLDLALLLLVLYSIALLQMCLITFTPII